MKPRKPSQGIPLSVAIAVATLVVYATQWGAQLWFLLAGPANLCPWAFLPFCALPALSLLANLAGWGLALDEGPRGRRGVTLNLLALAVGAAWAFRVAIAWGQG